MKADPEIPSKIDGKKNPKYSLAHANAQSASRDVDKYEQQIADLEAQIEEQKLKTAQAEEKEKAVATELQKYKFDDAKTRSERVKRLSSSLTVSVPQALADLQKFFAEVDAYPDDVRKHVLENATHLANYIGDHL